jgi:FkbM family methyltransferase
MLHLSRRLRNPGLPPDRDLMKIRCRGKEFSIEIRRWGSDRAVVKQCFSDLQYDFPQRKYGAWLDNVYRRIVDSGRKPLIVDCGANIGASALWFHARYPAAHIVAIEPAPDNFTLLQKNTRGLDIDLRQAALGPVCGEASLSSGDGESWGYRVNDRNEGLSVSVISIERVLESKPASQFAPFLLKLDIEGAEKSLFDGDNAVFDSFPLILMEPHDWLLPGEGVSHSFFRFHAEAGREFDMKHENVASISYPCAELR